MYSLMKKVLQAVGLSILLAVIAAMASTAAHAGPKHHQIATKNHGKVVRIQSRGQASRQRVASGHRVREGRSVRRVVMTRHGRRVVVIRNTRDENYVRASYVPRVAPVVTPRQPSYGQLAGLHHGDDPLELRSSVALVMDQDTREVLYSKNDSAVLPIASLTKLMTGLLISEANLPMDQMITITDDDIDTEKHSGSRLRVGTTLSRGELLHLALMSSENRAAHALARTYPAGLAQFVSNMNAKAASLGMAETHYVEPTGLSSQNQSSARDLAKLVNVASRVPLLRELTTSPEYQVEVGNRTLQYNNTNRLVKNPGWDIGLQKTGFINEAGECLVMQTKIAGRKLIMVFLDSAGKLSRIGDAERVRRWVESRPVVANPSHPTAG